MRTNRLRILSRHFRWPTVGQSFVDRATSVLSLGIIPIAIAIVSAIAILAWDDLYSSQAERPLDLSAYVQTSRSPVAPTLAAHNLSSAPQIRFFDTKLSEAPVWFSFQLPSRPSIPSALELPSRHAKSLSCWTLPDFQPVGSANHEKSTGAVFEVKAGFAVRLDPSWTALICTAQFVGPARLSGDLWTQEKLEISNRDYHRRSGLTDGGLLMLALFVLVTALVNRKPLYLIFAAWLIVTMRISATSGGWDDQWLNHAVPEDFLNIGRSLTRAAWALLSIAVFKSLFETEIRSRHFLRLVSAAQWLCISLFTLPFMVPRTVYYPALWAVGGFVLVVITGSLLTVVRRTKSTAAYLYAASFAITLLSTLAEILAAAFGAQGLIGSTYGVIAALATGLLAALAIAEQMRQEHLQRVEAQAKLQQTFDAVPVGLFSMDMEGRFLSANPAMCQRVGERNEVLMGRRWANYFNEAEWSRLREMVEEVATVEIEIRDCFLPGSTEARSFLVKATQVQDKIEGSLQDVTEKLRAADHLRFIANHDMLTQALNRRGVEKNIENALGETRTTRPLTLVYLNLDRFKLVNELYGRNAGDAVLQHACSRISTVLAPRMSLGRLGGDEFLLVMPDTPVDLATHLAQRIIESISGRPFVINDKAFHVRCSAGLIELTPGSVIKDSISTAERACRQAKKQEGNRLSVYHKGAPAFADYEAEMMLVELLAAPNATESMYLNMQPIMSLGAPFESINFEVLLRMRDAEGRTVRTDHLIRAAESSGRVGMVDRWVLTTLFAWLNQNYTQLQHTRFVCVNLNGASLNDERFLEDVVMLLTANHAVAHHVCFEVTESVALHDLSNTRRFISKVRTFGAKVALDDFGAGYTSFSYLKDLPADLLKIDGSFIVDMNQHPANVAIVEAIVNLAGNLGMKTIAEWAEDIATVQTLRDLGVDYVQGYVVSKPLDPQRLLGASSSAEFIGDNQLREVLRQSTAGDAEPQEDLFGSASTTQRH